jgi:hypothetical protein
LNRIQPVHFHAQGPAVADLHAGLLFLIRNQSGISDNDRSLLEKSLASELRDKVYQKVTTRLVTLFQEQLASQFQLVVNGDVDRATADALNKALGELGAFGTQSDDAASYDVAGTVSSPDSATVGGLHVQIVDKNVGTDVVLGEATTDKDGRYHLRFSAAKFGGKAQPDLQARVFAERLFLAASDIHYHATHHETLDVHLAHAPPRSIPDQIPAPALAGFLQTRMAGTPSDGSDYQGSPPASVVWVDAGDEVLVHLDSLKTQVVGQSVVVSIDLESEQTGRTPLVVVFALGTDDQGGLIAATDEYPRGDGALVARWGPAVQAAAWNAMLSLAVEHATGRGLAPRGLAVVDGQLRLIAGQALKVAPR